MKVRCVCVWGGRGGGGGGRCVYMPTDCMNSASIEGCYERM